MIWMIERRGKDMPLPSTMAFFDLKVKHVERPQSFSSQCKWSGCYPCEFMIGKYLYICISMPLLRSCLPTFTCLWPDRLYVGLEEDENNMPCDGPNG